MINNEYFTLLANYPFERLRVLLSGLVLSSNQVINMSIGEPQHQAPDLIHKILSSHSEKWSHYPPVSGTEHFRFAVAKWLTHRFDLQEGWIDPNRHVLPVAGTREALYMCANLIVPRYKAGLSTVVLVPNPFYQVYVGAATMTGAQPIYLPAKDWLNSEELNDNLLNRTALAFLCTPANPQGYVASLNDLRHAITLARRYNFVLAVDECYSEIYDSVPPPGALQACATLDGNLNNVIVFHSLSKRSNVPGLRSGFVVGDPNIISSFTRIRGYGGVATPLPIVEVATALWKDEAHVIENRALYRAKLDIAEHILSGCFEFYRPPGTFFLWLRVGDGEKTARILFQETGILTLPGRYLAQIENNGINPGHDYIRIALVHDIDITTSALERLHHAIKR